jgi:hypothetical protein
MERLERLAGRLAHGVGLLDAENADGILETANLVSAVTEELASPRRRTATSRRRWWSIRRAATARGCVRCW